MAYAADQFSADVFEAMVHGLHTLQSTPESGNCAGYDGYKRRRGSKVHAAATHGIELMAVALPDVKRGFVLLPLTVDGLHFVALACLMLHRLRTLAAHSP